jgi:retron-type reverse transcriptase
LGFWKNTAAPRQLLHPHQWLRKMVTHRIADRTILEVIGKWLKAGAMVDGAFSKDPKFGCGQQDRHQRSL